MKIKNNKKSQQKLKLKKFSLFGLSNKLSLAVVAGLILTTVAGGWFYYQKNTDDAGAYNWTFITSNASEGQIYGCRFTSNIGQSGVRYRRYNPTGKKITFSNKIGGVYLPAANPYSYSSSVVSWSGSSSGLSWC